MGMLRVLGRSGDEAREWNPSDPIEVLGMDRIFGEHLKNGCAAFATDGPNTGRQIKTFEPEAREIIITRPLQGG